MELTTTWKEEGRQEGLLAGRQEGLLAGRQEGRQEGLLAGRQEGRQEGKQAEALHLTRRLLSRRFGLLPPALDEQLGTLALSQLETLIEDLLDFTSLDAVQHWLAANPPASAESDDC